MKTSDIITGIVVWVITLILDAIFKHIKKRISTNGLRTAARRIWIGAGFLLICVLSAQAGFAGFFAYVLHFNPPHRPGAGWQSVIFLLLGLGSLGAALSTQRDLYEFGLSRGRHLANTQTLPGSGARLDPYMAASRLGNVLTAIQVMGVNQQAAMKVADWHQLLGSPKDEADWGTIFGEHPEFFKLNGDWAVLRMRLAYVPLYDTKEMMEISRKDYELLTDDERQKLSKKPISSDDMGTLLKLATELHGAAIARQQERRWRLPLWVAGLSLGGSVLAVTGTIAAAIIASQTAINVTRLGSTLSQRPAVTVPVSALPSPARPAVAPPVPPVQPAQGRRPKSPIGVLRKHGGFSRHIKSN